MEEITGILRHIGPIETKEEWKGYSKRDLTFDNGHSYEYFSTNKRGELELEYAIGQEIVYSVNDKGRLKLHKIPPAPKKTIPVPKKGEGVNRESYWENKDDRDAYDLVVREHQYYINHAKEFVLALGRITDGNDEELMEKAIVLGIQMHEKYGKYRFG